jgi:hypothetical protein
MFENARSATTFRPGLATAPGDKDRGAELKSFTGKGKSSWLRMEAARR